MFRQTLVHESTGSSPALVTYAEPAVGPVRVADRVVLERESPVVWFTFPGTWHDIGRFHSPDGTFTGYYANVLTPVEIKPGTGSGSEDIDEADVWRTTDLFLDVFLAPDGAVHLLDRSEFEDAARKGWLEPATVGAAEAEAERLVRLAGSGDWPPPVVDEWPLDRARAVALHGR